ARPAGLSSPQSLHRRPDQQQNTVDAGRAFAQLLFRSCPGTDMTGLFGDTDDAQMASACPH
ncbi:MAG: hypothetical protein WCD30_14805, partial [Pseudolabrys sp.]